MYRTVRFSFEAAADRMRTARCSASSSYAWPSNSRISASFTGRENSSTITRHAAMVAAEAAPWFNRADSLGGAYQR